MNTCKQCAHAEWNRTPTGRIKRDTCGKCLKASEIVDLFNRELVMTAPPCVSVYKAGINAIWPNNDADKCPHFQEAA